MRLPVVLHLIGTILRFFSLLFAGPAIVSAIYGEHRDVVAFTLSGAGSAVVGHVMVRMRRRTPADLRRVEALAVAAGSWLVVAIAAAIPFVPAGLSYVDALFESMSGLTPDFDSCPRLSR